MSKCLVYETLGSVNEMKRVTTEEGLMTLSGTFGVCGVKNNNNRIYEKTNYGKCVESLQKKIKENGGIPGELEHPEGMNITLENISHKITDIQMDENGVVSGTIQLLNTPKGKIAQSIVEGGLPLFVSSRAMGQVDKNGYVQLENLATYDLVGSPGFSQAKMHLNESQTFESITESLCIISENKGTNEDMTNEEILQKLTLLESRIEELEDKNEELQNELDEARQNTQNIDLEKLADGIQKWVIEQYSPEIQKWVMNEAAEEIRQGVSTPEQIDVKKLADGIQKWVIEQYSPEIQKWVIEQYSPEVQNWVLEQFAPRIQKWIIEQYSPEVEAWINEDYSESVKTMISEHLKDNKDNKMKSIAETLSLLEGLDVSKPTYNGRMITESNVNEPEYIREMPASMRPLYEMATPEQKDYIARKATIFNFGAEGAIERFWESINFENIKPAKNIYEGLENILDQRERAIRAQFRRHKQL